MYIRIIKDRKPIYYQVYSQIRDKILSGEVRQDTKMPSIRELASQLSLSVTTIENAYNQLQTEGYIIGRERMGYYVEEIKSFHTEPKSNIQQVKNTRYINTGVTSNTVDLSIWKRHITKAINNPSVLTPPDFNGELVLRQEIMKFISRYRGVRCHSEQIIISSGVQQLLCIILSLISEPIVGYETPGFEKAIDLFNLQKVNSCSIHIAEDISIDNLVEQNINLLYTSPSHQYPTGAVMSVGNRQKLIEWASDTESYIIEDDHDSILRYRGQPVPSMQGMDKGNNIIYIGSFSSLFIPSLRLSYMVLPEKLLAEYNKSTKYSQSASKIDQLAMSSFMMSGEFDKHIRKIRKIYRKKNELLINIIGKYRPDIKVDSDDAGGSIILEFKNEFHMDKFANNCAQKDILVRKISKESNKVLLRYTGLPSSDMESLLYDITKN